MHHKPKAPAPTESLESAAPAPEQEMKMVRYSLPQLLAEISRERSEGAMAMDKLHQAQITKLFQNNPKPRRGKAKR